ncbi:hypothetical protein NC651_034590 [Populus alba x Populus x berolinensis]|nr:hypothetical protein NC651_034590 [Populus alba x Populus x berolinensis]
MEEENPAAKHQDSTSGSPDHSQACSRKPSLSSLEIPARSIEAEFYENRNSAKPSSAKPGLPPRPSSAKFKSTVKSLLPQRSLKAKNLIQDGEKTVLIVPDTPPSDSPAAKPSTSRSFSLNKVLFPLKSTNSLPVTPSANSDPEALQERNVNSCSDYDSRITGPIGSYHEGRSSASYKTFIISSGEYKVRSLRRTDSGGGLFRVVSATPRPVAADSTSTNDASTTEIVIEDDGEDIPEDEAVCRICLVELSEGGDAFKMIHNPQAAGRRPLPAPQQREVARYRVWQDVPVLVMVSMLAYFCFLEQLLVSDLGPRALAISLPFSCVLGLLSSMIATTMVSRSYIWAYASFQFAVVILFAHIFYTVQNNRAVQQAQQLQQQQSTQTWHQEHQQPRQQSVEIPMLVPLIAQGNEKLQFQVRSSRRYDEDIDFLQRLDLCCTPRIRVFKVLAPGPGIAFLIQPMKFHSNQRKTMIYRRFWGHMRSLFFFF